MTPPKVTIENLLEDTGGCGLFQWIIALFLHGSTMTAAWGFTFMAFGNYNPGWTCGDDVISNSSSIFNHETNTSSNGSNPDGICSIHKDCGNVVYKSDASTIVTEWNLACDNDWIASTIISVQMMGSLVGALFSGHLNHYIGRKATFYGTVLLYALLNLIAMFAINWPMYAAMRFLLGAAMTSLYMCAYIYPIEFIVNKWRGPFSALPATNTSYLLFAATAMILRDWRKLHLATAIFTIVWFVPIFWVPESLRWLAIKGKHNKAHKVITKIAQCNKSPPVDTEVVSIVLDKEFEREQKRIDYTAIDLYRPTFLLRTLIITGAWLSFTVIYYAIVYGVRSLSGDLYTNLILMAIVNSASYPIVILFANTVGRRWGTIIFLSIGSMCCLCLLSTSYLVNDADQGMVVTALSLTLMGCIDGSWVLVALLTVELYPTVLRPISYSNASCIARIGGMIAPFLIPNEHRSASVSYIIMGVLALITCISFTFLPETKGQHMTDSIHSPKRYCDGEDQTDC